MVLNFFELRCFGFQNHAFFSRTLFYVPPSSVNLTLNPPAASSAQTILPFLYCTARSSHLFRLPAAPACQKADLMRALRNRRTFFTTQWCDHHRSLSKCRASQACFMLYLSLRVMTNPVCSYEKRRHLPFMPALSPYVVTRKLVVLLHCGSQMPIWLSSLL